MAKERLKTLQMVKKVVRHKVNKIFLNRLVMKEDAQCWREAITRSMNPLRHIVEQNVILQPSLLKIASFSYTAVTFWRAVDEFSPSHSFFHSFFQVSHYLCYTQQKKMCDEKDRLIISTWVFGMIQVPIWKKIDRKQTRSVIRIIFSQKKSRYQAGSIILGEIGQI